MKEPPQPRRALVTGATGFIGSHLLRHLEAAGWRIATVTRNVSPDSSRRGSGAFLYSGQTSEVLAAVATFQPCVVFHLASLFLADHTPEQVSPLIESNVLFGAQLLEAMRQAGCTALVNAGTSWQSYTPGPPFDTGAFRPVNLYAATKQAFEDLMVYYVETAGLRVVTLRLFDSYGPGDTRRKLLRLLLNVVKTGVPLGMSPGDQVLDLVHVDDICRAFLHAAERALAAPAPQAEVFALRGERRLTVREVAATLEEAAGTTLPLRFGERPHRPREVMHPWEGPSLPGWSPQILLVDGFRDLLERERKN